MWEPVCQKNILIPFSLPSILLQYFSPVVCVALPIDLWKYASLSVNLWISLLFKTTYALWVSVTLSPSVYHSSLSSHKRCWEKKGGATCDKRFPLTSFGKRLPPSSELHLSRLGGRWRSDDFPAGKFQQESEPEERTRHLESIQRVSIPGSSSYSLCDLGTSCFCLSISLLILWKQSCKVAVRSRESKR